nr:alpha-ribazole phosphatase family protein [uncultured Flavobacterium sp.]
MEVFVSRHTRVSVPSGICYGQTDVALRETFLEEIDQFKHRIPTDLDIVFSSPLQRCVQVAKTFSEEINTDNRLLEMDFGLWEMKAWNDIPLVEIQPWYDDFVFTKTPNGENFEMLFLRLKSFLDELRTKDYQKVLIVTHAGIIRAIWTYLLETPLQNAFKIPIGFEEILHFNLGKTSNEDYIIEKK